MEFSNIEMEEMAAIVHAKGTDFDFDPHGIRKWSWKEKKMRQSEFENSLQQPFQSCIFSLQSVLFSSWI